MPSLGVNVAIIENGRPLLTQREDFEAWCMPGGEVDPGETWAQAAAREAREETGLEVRLERLVGVYSRPGTGRFSGHVALFAGRAVGGELRTQPGETIDLRFFDPGALPPDLLPAQPQRIHDLVAGAGGSVAWFHNRLWPFEPGMGRSDLYARLEQEGISPAQFYWKYLGVPGPGGDVLEVPSQDDLSAHFSAGSLLPEAQRMAPVEVGANVALVQHGKILLTRRQDFDVWCLPGGGVEPGESLAQAARREMREETGLEVTLERLVGLYSEPRWEYRGLHVATFAASQALGELRPQVEEVSEVGFFGQDELPEDILFGHRQRAIDALNGIGGSLACTQATPWPFDPALTRQEIYALRDRSGLSRLEFFRQHYRPARPEEEILEVGLAPLPGSESSPGPESTTGPAPYTG